MVTTEFLMMQGTVFRTNKKAFKKNPEGLTVMMVGGAGIEPTTFGFGGQE